MVLDLEQRPDPSAPHPVERGGRASRFVVLQERGSREEYRPDEEGEVVGVGPHSRGIGRKEPRAKQIDPTAKARPSTTEGSRRPPHVLPAGDWAGCLRCQRDSQMSRVPSGRPNTSRVTKGPRPWPPSRSPALGYLHVGRSHRGSPGRRTSGESGRTVARPHNFPPPRRRDSMMGCARLARPPRHPPRFRLCARRCSTRTMLGSRSLYRELLGYGYRPGDEVPPAGEDYLKGLGLARPGRSVRGHRAAFQQVAWLPRSTRPGTETPQQVHLDLDGAARTVARGAARTGAAARGAAPPRPFRRPGGAPLRVRRSRRPPLLHLRGAGIGAPDGPGRGLVGCDSSRIMWIRQRRSRHGNQARVVARRRAHRAPSRRSSCPIPGRARRSSASRRAASATRTCTIVRGGINDEFPFLLGHEAAGVVQTDRIRRHGPRTGRFRRSELAARARAVPDRAGGAGPGTASPPTTPGRR